MVRKLSLALLLLAPLGFYPFLRDQQDPVVDDPPVNAPHIIKLDDRLLLGQDERLALSCFSIFPAQSFPGAIPWESLRRIGRDEPLALSDDERLALSSLSIFPAQPFPAAIPWESIRRIGQQQAKALEDLARAHPIEFLQFCLDRYEREVQGYRCVFDKRERVNNKLRQKEKIVCHFRSKPFSVHMDWKKGNDLLGAVRTLYVEGENDGLLVARATLGLIVHKKVDDPQAKQTSRFPITQFGVYQGAWNTVNSMRQAKQKGTLYVRYEGVELLKEVGNRPCYKLVRKPHSPPEDDGVNELIIYIDQATLLQVGSVLNDIKGELIAEYYFHTIELNPTFLPEQFTIKSL